MKQLIKYMVLCMRSMIVVVTTDMERSKREFSDHNRLVRTGGPE